MTVQILRLSTGEDVMGDITLDSNENFEISDPLIVEIEFNNKESQLVMSHWLPVQLLDKNQAIIIKEHVLAKLVPSTEFMEYYTNTVGKVKELVSKKELAKKPTKEELLDVLEALEQIGNQSIH